MEKIGLVWRGFGGRALLSTWDIGTSGQDKYHIIISIEPLSHYNNSVSDIELIFQAQTVHRELHNLTFTPAYNIEQTLTKDPYR